MAVEYCGLGYGDVCHQLLHRRDALGRHAGSRDAVADRGPSVGKLHYRSADDDNGFTEEIDIPRDLAPIGQLGISLDPMRTSYFLSRQKLIAAREVAGMALWREHLFAWMSKASESAMDYFQLPANRVIELGSQVRI